MFDIFRPDVSLSRLSTQPLLMRCLWWMTCIAVTQVFGCLSEQKENALTNDTISSLCLQENAQRLQSPIKASLLLLNIYPKQRVAPSC